jgi:hypothetical protein
MQPEFLRYIAYLPLSSRSPTELKRIIYVLGRKCAELSLIGG